MRRKDLLRILNVANCIGICSRQRIAKYGLIAVGEMFAECLEPGDTDERSELTTKIEHASRGHIVFGRQTGQC